MIRRKNGRGVCVRAEKKLVIGNTFYEKRNPLVDIKFVKSLRINYSLTVLTSWVLRGRLLEVNLLKRAERDLF